MSAPRPLVFLFRSGEEPDPYERTLDDAGFDARSIPVLQFAPLNTDRLLRVLEHPKDYEGIILTSPRAAHALAAAVSRMPSAAALWQPKAVFVVGPRTAEAVRAFGFQPVGEEFGSAENLASHLTMKSFTKPLLFLCGDRRLDTIPHLVGEAGIAVEELCVYTSLPRTDLDFLSSERPDWAVFFSPSGLEAVENARGFDLNAVSIAAIGATTAEALRERGYDVRARAEMPAPEALLAALRDAEESNARAPRR